MNEVWLKICKSINTIHLINRLTGRNRVIISIGTEEEHEKPTIFFMIKALEKQGTEE